MELEETHVGSRARVLSFEEAREIFLQRNSLHRQSLLQQGDIVCSALYAAPNGITFQGDRPRFETQPSQFSNKQLTEIVRTKSPSPQFTKPVIEPLHSNDTLIRSSQDNTDNLCVTARHSSRFKLQSLWRDPKQSFSDLFYSVSKLDKFYLVLMWTTLYLSIFSISLIVFLTFVWPAPNGRDAAIPPGITTSPQMQTTPIRLSNTLASPMDTPGNTTPSSIESLRQKDLFWHLPMIDQCFVNWTRLSFSWSYKKPFQNSEVESKNEDTAVENRVKLFCLHKSVLRGPETVSSEFVLLPPNVDSFKYYRGGYGERHGNNLFMLSLAPCMLGSPWNETNGHLAKQSNHTSVYVAARFVTKKNFFCSYTYDISAFFQLVHLASQKTLLREKHDDFIDACYKACHF